MKERPAEEFLTTSEAAKLLGVSPATLATRRSRGGGPIYHKIMGAVRYRRKELEGWLSKRAFTNTAQAQLAKEGDES